MQSAFYPMELNGNIIVIGIKSKFYENVVNGYLWIIENIVSKMLGKKMKVEIKIVKYLTEKDQKEDEERQFEKQRKLKEQQDIESYQILEKRKESSRIPAHAFIDERFEDLEITEDNKNIIEKCRNFILNEKRNYWFLTLSGKTGTSKTHLMFAMGVEAVKHKDVQYWHCGELLDLFQRGQFDQSYFLTIDKLKTIPLLILDDYGDFKETEFKTEKLDILIDSRYENRYDTVITTNKTLKELIVMNQRVASRLIENMFIQTKGEDYRVRLSKNKIITDTDKPIVRGMYVSKSQGVKGW
jgi:DNA replication protein DnaC